MPLRRDLFGDEVVSILGQFGFGVVSQRGSHVKLRRVSAEGGVQTLTIPKHRHLDIGTTRAIFKQASRYIPEDHLRKRFYRP